MRSGSLSGLGRCRSATAVSGRREEGISKSATCPEGPSRIATESLLPAFGQAVPSASPSGLSMVCRRKMGIAVPFSTASANLGPRRRPSAHTASRGAGSRAAACHCPISGDAVTTYGRRRSLASGEVSCLASAAISANCDAG